MFGVIAWIRADGRKALVVVEGSSLMAAGDPGVPKAKGFAVGDLVFLPHLSSDLSTFESGLTLIRPEFWPKIRLDIFQLGSDKTQGRGVPSELPGNVINLFERRCQSGPAQWNRKRIVAAE